VNHARNFVPAEVTAVEKLYGAILKAADISQYRVYRARAECSHRNAGKISAKL